MPDSSDSPTVKEGALWVLLPFVIAFEHILFWAIDHYPTKGQS